MSTVEGGGNIVTDGLVLYLDAANKRSYPGSETVWSDLSSSIKNGSLINGPTFNSENGGSIVFDGTNDLVELSGIDGLTSFTISIWFKMTGPGITGGSTNTYYDSLFGISGSRRILVASSAHPTVTEGAILVQMGGSNYFSTSLTVTNAWNNVVYTFSSNTAILYINGVAQTPQSNSSVTFPSTTIYIGSYSNPIISYAMKGNISQSSIYNRSLSASEVIQNYNAIKGRYI